MDTLEKRIYERQRTLLKLIGSMSPDFKYDKYIKKTQLDPYSLRTEFNTKIENTMRLYRYSNKINTNPQYNDNIYRELNTHDYSIYHYLDNRLYHPLNVPNDIPTHPQIGVTKMYTTIDNDNGELSSLLIVTFNEIDNTFKYINVHISCAEIYGPRDRYYNTWRYSPSEDVCIDTFYSSYPMILKDFIEDTNIGAEQIIRYARSQFNL